MNGSKKLPRCCRLFLCMNSRLFQPMICFTTCHGRHDVSSLSARSLESCHGHRDVFVTCMIIPQFEKSSLLHSTRLRWRHWTRTKFPDRHCPSHHPASILPLWHKVSARLQCSSLSPSVCGVYEGKLVLWGVCVYACSFSLLMFLR